MIKTPDQDTWYSRISPTSTVPSPAPSAQLRRELLARRVSVGALVILLMAGATGRLGVTRDVTTVTRGGSSLVVTHPAISRPGLASSWTIVAKSRAGFQEPPVLAITHDYFEVFDFNNLSPQPTAAWADGEMIVMEFERPVGETLTIHADVRLEPGWHAPRRAVVEWRVGSLDPLAVELVTWVLP